MNKSNSPVGPLVYFIAPPGIGPVKIGSTKGPLIHRLMALRIGSPLELAVEAWTPGDCRLETELHHAFSHDRSHGEWFRRTERLEALMASIGMGGQLDRAEFLPIHAERPAKARRTRQARDYTGALFRHGTVTPSSSDVWDTVNREVDEHGLAVAAFRLGINRRTLTRFVDGAPVFPCTIRRLRERIGELSHERHHLDPSRR